MEFKHDRRTKKAYAVYEKTSNRVSTTNLPAHHMRQLMVSLVKKYLAKKLAMFENVSVPTLSRKKIHETLQTLCREESVKQPLITKFYKKNMAKWTENTMKMNFSNAMFSNKSVLMAPMYGHIGWVLHNCPQEHDSVTFLTGIVGCTVLKPIQVTKASN